MVSKAAHMAEPVANNSRVGLRLALGIMLCAAVCSNAYLLYLYFEVQRAAKPENVQSFCSVAEGVDCVKVAASRYSSIFGVPIALLGLEFYALALLPLLFSTGRRPRVQAWASMIFVLMVLALPVSLVMAWVSIAVVRSVCLLCSVVYLSNVLTLVVLAVSYRGQLSGLFSKGPKEMLTLAKSRPLRIFAVAAAALAVAQCYWVPKSTAPPTGHSAQTHKNPWADLPRRGLAVGNPQARVQIEEFSDFQCPACSRLHHVMAELMTEMSDRVQLRHRDYPLDQACNRKITRAFHEHACLAASYARCVAEQGKFWHFSTYLFSNQHSLGRNQLRAYVRQVGADLERVDRCLAAFEARQAISQDIEEGIRRDISGTPTVYVNGREVEADRRMLQVDFWRQKVKDALKTR